MDFEVCFSWQNEKPSVSNRIFKILKECCDELSVSYNVGLSVTLSSEAHRRNLNSTLIGGASILVADLTPTSSCFDGRLNPNANVMYEYSKALTSLGVKNVIAVIDLDGIQVDQIPFEFKDIPYIGIQSTADDVLKEALKAFLRSFIDRELPPILHNTTTVFFSKRIASGFPGVRNLKTYVDPYDIKRHLNAFFKAPLKFREVKDREGDREPIWWFRGQLAEAIDHFEVLPNGVFLIGSNEFKIKRITVFSNHTRYFWEYIYIETAPLPPIDKEYFTLDRIEEMVKELDVVEEEYAVIKEEDRQIEISRAEYDDGHAEIDGEFVSIRGRASLRCRFLSPYNMIIAAKFSPYNCRLFCAGSDEYFNGLLKGTIDYHRFHSYLMGFPRYTDF